MTTAEHDSSTGGNEHPLSDNIWDSFSAFPQILIFFAYPAAYLSLKYGRLRELPVTGCPSAADVRFYLRQLHLRRLPDFDGRLRPHGIELLLQYLTVPYLRIPLVLDFF